MKRSGAGARPIYVRAIDSRRLRIIDSWRLRAGQLHVGAGLALIYAVVGWLVWSGFVLRAPAALGAASTVDLTITAAVMTWWLGSRRGALPRRAPWVVLALGLVAARLLLPAEARGSLSVLRGAWALVELATLVAIVAQVGAIRRRARALRASGAASVDALEGALASAVGALPARLVATELDVMGWAIGGWWRATPVEDARTFSVHRRRPHAVLVGVLVFLMAVESTLLHVVVSRSAPAMAWVLSGSSLWLALWLVGDAHALRLQPLVLGADALEVRVGVRWRVRVPYAAIARVVGPDEPAVGATLPGTVMRAADLQIVLSRPLEARGALGRTRRFETLRLSVDRVEEFRAALARRL
jgi:hypothetical protein